MAPSIPPGRPVFRRQPEYCSHETFNSTISDMKTGDTGRSAAKRRYPNKASWYQDEADTKRMRAAFHATKDILGYASLSEFINAAVNDKVAGLEAEYNGGQPWLPIEAGRIPQGKPARRTSPGLATAAHVPAKMYLAALIRSVQGDLSPAAEDTRVTVFEGSSGLEAVIESYDVRRETSVLRHFEALHAADFIQVRTAAGVAWDQEEVSSALLFRVHRSGEQDLGEELAGVVEKSRTQLAEKYRKPLSGEVKVYRSQDGLESMIDSYDAGDGASTIHRYGVTASTSSLYVRVASHAIWEEAEAISYSRIQA